MRFGNTSSPSSSTGSNLLDIAAALRVNSVERITGFDGPIHLPVNAPYAPLIEKIDTEYVDNPFLLQMQERNEKGECTLYGSSGFCRRPRMRST